MSELHRHWENSAPFGCSGYVSEMTGSQELQFFHPISQTTGAWHLIVERRAELLSDGVVVATVTPEIRQPTDEDRPDTIEVWKSVFTGPFSAGLYGIRYCVRLADTSDWIYPVYGGLSL